VQVPEVKLPLRDITVDEDGRVWVHRYAQTTERRISTTPRRPDSPPPLTWRDIPTFHVFEASAASWVR
jgi:hypothetical protein